MSPSSAVLVWPNSRVELEKFNVWTSNQLDDTEGEIWLHGSLNRRLQTGFAMWLNQKQDPRQKEKKS